MCAEHLRKQAKTLVNLYPALVADHPSELALSAAQDVIARINGYPNWEAMIFVSNNDRKAGLKQDRVTARSSASPLVSKLQKAVYFHCDPEPRDLPVSFSRRDGSPTKYRQGYEARISYTSRAHRIQAERADEALDSAFEDAGVAFNGGLDTIEPQDIVRLITIVEASLERCPFNLEGISRLTGCYLELDRHAEALAVIEPVAEAVLSMLPEYSIIHVSYYELDNRQFHRMMLHYVLALDGAQRHVEADSVAKRMLQLWPGDNIGFRFIKANRHKPKGIRSVIAFGLHSRH